MGLGLGHQWVDKALMTKIIIWQSSGFGGTSIGETNVIICSLHDFTLLDIYVVDWNQGPGSNYHERASEEASDKIIRSQLLYKIQKTES